MKTLQLCTNVRQQISKSKRSSRNFDEGAEGWLIMAADRPIRAGEEVTISYGNLSDAQLLQTYGFVEEHEGFTNPWNSVVVPSDAVVQVRPMVHSLRGNPLTGIERRLSLICS